MPVVPGHHSDVFNVDGTKENKDPNYVSIEDSCNLSDKIAENGSKSQINIKKKKEPEIEEAKQVVDYDVERVIAEQETHDLFCPNCHSCIAKELFYAKENECQDRSLLILCLRKKTNVPFVAPEVDDTPPEVGNAPVETKNAHHCVLLFHNSNS